MKPFPRKKMQVWRTEEEPDDAKVFGSSRWGPGLELDLGSPPNGLIFFLSSRLGKPGGEG